MGICNGNANILHVDVLHIRDPVPFFRTDAKNDSIGVELMQDEGVDMIVEALVKIHMVHVRGARSMLRRLRAAFAV